MKAIKMINIEAFGSKIFIWGRDKDKKLYKQEIKSFCPYFYITSDDGNYTSAFGEKVKKIFTREPSDVPKVRLMYDRHFEADVLYTLRYLIDKVDKIEEEPIKVCFLDIETESGKNAPQSFPDFRNPLNKIIAIGVFNNFNNEYKIFCLNPEVKFDKCEVVWCKTEEELMKSFSSYIQKEDFDILSGYNIDGFDAPYIINRTERLRLDTSKLTRGGKAFVEFNFEKPNIYGRAIFDIYWAYRYLNTNERSSWKLNDVGQDELGYGKVDFTEEDVGELFLKDKEKFLNYNFTDVKLLVDLDKKLGLIDFFNNLRMISKTDWKHLFKRSIVNDCLVLQYCKDRFILPSKTRRENVESYEGAHTQVYHPGLHENIVIMDYKSLYPTIAVIHNVSFETKTSDTNGFTIGNNVFFSKEKLGIIPEILINLFEKRKYYKDLMKKQEPDSDDYQKYDNMQRAMKILLNSLYGYLGYSGSRVYDPDCAETITKGGKKILLKTKEIAENLGYKVCYTHTDSLYFSIPAKDIKELEAKGKELSKRIEQEVRKIVPENHLAPQITLDLEFEKICQTAFFGKVKNRNARLVVWKDGKWLSKPKLEITGFSSIRSETPDIIKKLTNDVFLMILNKSDEDEVNKHILKFKKDFIAGKYSPVEIAISTSIGKEVPLTVKKGLSYHIKASVNANKHFDAHIRQGDKVKLIYTKETKKYNFNCIAFKEKMPSSKLKIDYRKMWKRYEKSLTDILETMNWFGVKTGSKNLRKYISK